jgi:hypothetical protein
MNVSGISDKGDSLKVYLKAGSNEAYKMDTVRRKLAAGVTSIELPFTVPKGRVEGKKDSVTIEAASGDKKATLPVFIVPGPEAFKETGTGIENYKITIGHSFDFFDSENRFISYSRFDAFRPDLISEHTGLHFYVLQTRFNTSTSLSRFGDTSRVLDVVSVTPRALQTGDSAAFAQNFYNRTIKSTFKAFGFGINGLIKLSGSGTTAGTSVYLSTGLEYIRREVTLKYEYALSTTDTFRQPKNYPLRISTNVKELKQVYHEIYGGVGVLVNNVNDVAHTRLRYTLGYLLTQGDKSSNFNPLKTEVGFSHWVNIEVIEKLTKLNLTMGVDWRQNKGEFLYNVYLSKSFSLGKLGDLLFED